MNTINNNLVLELHVPDFKKAREFYSLLGFKEIQYDPTSGGGSTLGYLVLLRKDPLGITALNFYGDGPNIFKHAHFNQFPRSTPRGYGVEITIPVKEIETLWKEIKDKISQKNISQKLMLKRWGQKDFRLVDPFGFYVRFTELVDWGQG